jgi:MOSC domain-containing protein YiiM
MKVLSIQIGITQAIEMNGRRIMSAIRKSPVQGPVPVNLLGLAGDEQADLSVHGGLSKAVYAYPSEHYAFWQARKPSKPLPFGSLGENLTLSGLLEQDVFVGDELHFPDCVLRVTQPRTPCDKFNAVMEDKLAAKTMAQTGFSGFYLAVAIKGSISAGQSFGLIAGSRQSPLSSFSKTAMFKTRLD